jgi:hypothetical protein
MGVRSLWNALGCFWFGGRFVIVGGGIVIDLAHEAQTIVNTTGGYRK